MTVNVKGTLFDEGGTALANTLCVVVAVDALIGQDGGGRVQRSITVTTNGSGLFSANIKPGKYILYANPTQNDSTTSTVQRQGVMLVPDVSGSVTLEEALEKNVTVTPSVLLQAQAAADAAAASAAASASSATSAADDAAAAGLAAGAAAISEANALSAAIAAGAQIYASTADGISGTSSGDFFFIAENGQLIVYLNNSGTADLQAAVGVSSFATRAEFVSSVGAGAEWQPGAIVVAGSEFYQRETDADEIADLPGFVPFGVGGPRHYGAGLDGTTDDSAALQRAIDNGAKYEFPFGTVNFVEIGPGVYGVGNALEIPPNTYISLRDCVLSLLPFTFDNMFRNKNARAMRPNTAFGNEPKDDGSGDVVAIRNDTGIRSAVAAWTPVQAETNVATPNIRHMDFGEDITTVTDIAQGSGAGEIPALGNGTTTITVASGLETGKMYRFRATIRDYAGSDSVGFSNAQALSGRDGALASISSNGQIDFLFVATEDNVARVFALDDSTCTFSGILVQEVTGGPEVTVGDFRYQMLLPGHPNYNDLPTDMRPSGDIRLRPALDRNFHLVGSGNVVLYGNGRFNRYGAGAVPGYREQVLNFGFAGDFAVENITIKESPKWAISNEHINGAVYRNITVLNLGWLGKAIDDHEPDWRINPGLPNQDGLNLRKGCQNVLIDGFHGTTGDDCIALTNLYAIDGSFSEKQNHFSSNWAPYGAATQQITIRNVTAKAIGTHHVIRLLSSDNNPIRFVVIDGIHDTGDQRDMRFNEYIPVAGRIDHEACVVIGDGRYGDTLSGEDAIRDITIRNITTTARHAVLFKGPARRIFVDGVDLKFDTLLGTESAARQKSLVGFIAGQQHPSQKVVAITKANPAVVTTETAHGLVTGKQVHLTGIQGMTELDKTTQTITRINDTQFSLDGVNSSAYGTFATSGANKENWVRDVDYLLVSDCTFSNIGKHNVNTNGTLAGYVVEMRDGFRLQRSKFSNVNVWSCASFAYLRDYGTTWQTTDVDGFFSYLMRGHFVRVDDTSPIANSGLLTNFKSVGRRYNQDQIIDGNVGKFYNDDFWFTLDPSCPEVTSDDDVPPTLGGSRVFFNSDTGLVPVKTMMSTRGDAWVHENRAWGQPVVCAATQNAAGDLALTSGQNVSSPPTGMVVWFVPGSTNTGGIGINLDDGGAIACRTVLGAGSDVPAGYLRAGVLTSAYFNGTNWIVDREAEYGSNANGHYTRYANGVQECWNNAVGAAGSTNESNGLWRGFVSWTFPVSFAATPVAYSTSTTSYRTGGTSSGADNDGCNLWHVSGESVISETDIGGVAKGRWY